MKEVIWKTKGSPGKFTTALAFVSFLMVLIPACKEKFDPPVKNVNTNFLVVEGVVNVGNEETNIRLSRTSGLKSDSLVVETGAQVKIEGEDNTSFALPDKGNGNYGVSSINLDTSIRYRLAINTSNGQQFVSEYVKMIKNPPIDSINYERTNNGVDIYINTHDDANITRYFRWQYDETWEHHAAYFATLKYIYNPDRGGIVMGVVKRDVTDPEIFKCFTRQFPSTIFLGSSEKLSQTYIHLPLRFIPNSAQELSVMYYIHVKQYALSKDEFDFLERMKKNTESIGSIFDAQPSQLNGNIKCVSNPDQPVVGYFGISNLSESSIFIKAMDVNWTYDYRCVENVITNSPDDLENKAGNTLPTNIATLGPFGSIATFRASAPECVDCRLNGGTNIKPDFWP